MSTSGVSAATSAGVRAGFVSGSRAFRSALGAAFLAAGFGAAVFSAVFWAALVTGFSAAFVATFSAAFLTGFGVAFAATFSAAFSTGFSGAFSATFLATFVAAFCTGSLTFWTGAGAGSVVVAAVGASVEVSVEPPTPGTWETTDPAVRASRSATDLPEATAPRAWPAALPATPLGTLRVSLARSLIFPIGLLRATGRSSACGVGVSGVKHGRTGGQLPVTRGDTRPRPRADVPGVRCASRGAG